MNEFKREGRGPSAPTPLTTSLKMQSAFSTYKMRERRGKDRAGCIACQGQCISSERTTTICKSERTRRAQLSTAGSSSGKGIWDVIRGNCLGSHCEWFCCCRREGWASAFSKCLKVKERKKVVWISVEKFLGRSKFGQARLGTKVPPD